MSLEKSLSQHFSSILQCVDATNDYTSLVIATVVIRVHDAHWRASERTLVRQTAQLLIQCATLGTHIPVSVAQQIMQPYT